MSLADASAELPSTPSPNDLPDAPATLKAMILELLATLHRERHDHEALRHRLDLLLRRLYGPRGERFSPDQPLLFDDAAAGPEPATTPATDAAAVPASAEPNAKSKRRGQPHGRRRLPANLPREPRHHELSPAERVCPDCGQVRIDIGVDKSEQLDYRPASLLVIEHFIHKYVCPCCRPNPSGTATPPAAEATPAAAAETRPAPAGDAAVPPPASALTPGSALPLGPPAAAATPTPADANMPTSPPTEPPPPPPLLGIVVAVPKPATPIPKGLPGPGLLAHLIVSKCVDHLPLYRLERVYERQGLLLPRSTTCDWLAAADLLRPLYVEMVARVMGSRVLHTDDTSVKLQDPATHLLSTAHLWAYLGDPAHPYNVYDFTTRRRRDGPATFLVNFKGYLQADAFSGYDGLYLPNPVDRVARIIEVACNAHARRKFYEARSSDAALSHQALAYYVQLYEIERQAKNQDDATRLRMRQDLAVPIWEQFQSWSERERPAVLPKSPMAEAIGYSLNHRTALRRYLDAGFLAIDNNVAEREMKRIAIGRKNWLFIGSVAGGHTAAVLLSCTSTCQRLGVEPWAYLTDVLERLPTTPAARLAELLPDRWQAARRAAAATPPEMAASSPDLSPN